MTRSILTLTFGVVFLGLSSCNRNGRHISEDTGKPNVLFLIIEDVSTNFGCYGVDQALTPHINRLAAMGTRFDNAYCQHPICAASRASFLTGLRPESTGVSYPYSYYFLEEVLPAHPTLAAYFRDQGYVVRNFGKIHHGKDLDEGICPPENRPPTSAYLDPNNLARLKAGEARSALPPFDMADLPDSRFADGISTDLALSALDSLSGGDKPFAISVGFYKPHLPLSAPKKYYDLYDPDDLPLAAFRTRPDGAPEIAYNRYNLQQYTWEHAIVDQPFSENYDRKLRHALFACISFVDAQVGRLLEKLEETGELDNTIIALVSDHGFHTGELNHWGKATVFEPSLKIPMIISSPGKFERNTNSPGLVELVDIFPTLVDLAGLPVPEYMEGTSVAPLMKEPEREWKSAVFSRTPRGLLDRIYGHSVRTDRYRYTEWTDYVPGTILGQELYDLQEDPLQTRNLAELPAYDETVDELATILKAGWKMALPEGVENLSDNKPAPPPYAWGREAKTRNEAWHAEYGGSPEMGWREATRSRLEQEAERMNPQKPLRP
jgi:iduronate 2-sulfatase